MPLQAGSSKQLTPSALDSLSTSILNALSAQVAVVDSQGQIIAINDAWTKFAIENGDPTLQSTGIGSNYFDVCAITDGGDAEKANEVLEKMKTILTGELDYFEQEYPCDSDTEERWFSMEVSPFYHQNQRLLLVVHTNITRRKRAARAQAEAELYSTQQRRQDYEIQSLEEFSKKNSLSVSQGFYGTPPIQESSPKNFQDLVHVYQMCLEHAVEQRSFKVDYPISENLRWLAEQLGRLKARPRDVVEIYLATLRHMKKHLIAQKFQIYAEEGRIMLLELMGYLASFYRTYAFGNTSHLSDHHLSSDSD